MNEILGGKYKDLGVRSRERWELKKMGEKEKGKKYFRTHEDLAIYQLAFETAMQIFEHSKKFPTDRAFPFLIFGSVIREVQKVSYNVNG